MVSLEDFGKPPAPPEQAPINWRANITFALVLLSIIIGGWLAWEPVTRTSLAYWNRSAEIADQGRFNTR